ncbi:phosphorylated IMV membrane protein [Equine molluscum contagiosum-like virus]|nr:phosphorylated IMV membrane protein [Equine molluscum contagiosum-like virus]
MDMLRTLRAHYWSIVCCGIALLVLACIFACVEFSKNKVSPDYTWRALCIVCFVTGSLALLGVVLFVGYGKYCLSAQKSVGEGARFNSSELEVNAQ